MIGFIYKDESESRMEVTFSKNEPEIMIEITTNHNNAWVYFNNSEELEVLIDTLKDYRNRLKLEEDNA